MKINGLKVYDAKKPLTLHITTEDVKRGKNKNQNACAAAQACMRIPDVAEAKVHISTTYIRIGDRWLRFTTPRPLRQEIIAFDRGGTFEPGDYTLGKVYPSRKVTGKQQGSKSERRTGKKRTHHLVKGIRQHAGLGTAKPR